jgi:hypothetical protein
MQLQAALAEFVAANKFLLGRYLAGFDDASALAQPPGLPNHVIWSMGHCAHTMHRAAQQVDGLDLPASDFTPGGTGSRDAFAIESISFGSTPHADPAAYPSLARARAIYDAACDRLSHAIAGASDERITSEAHWANTKLPLYMIVLRMTFHNGMHTGQIADCRRVLGMKSIF